MANSQDSGGLPEFVVDLQGSGRRREFMADS